MKRITAAQKNKLMTKLMKTPTGRKRIAANVQEPLRQLRDYSSVGRKALYVDELPDGALPIYDKDIDTPAYKVSEEGDSIEVVIHSKRMMVGLFELAANPTIPFTQVKERRFDVVRRITKKTKDELFRKEDNIIFSTFGAVCANNTENVSLAVTDGVDFDMETFTDGFANIERHGLVVDKIFMNPKQYKVFRNAGREYLSDETLAALLKIGQMGTLWGATVYQSVEVEEGSIYLLTEPDYLGVMPIRIDLTVINADVPAERKFGWSVFEQIGVGVHNQLGTQGIIVA